ncbi:MAG: hypothetical protein OXL39_07660 [Caldilineaceae bacterium]|nr:hypothetical protein [Caldilineaceae bacterium]
MTKQTMDRRQFLRATARLGMAVTVANSFWWAATPVQAQTASPIRIPEGLEILSLPSVQNHVTAGRGSLWVAGRFLNSFRQNMVFENLPSSLQTKYHYAGAEYKNLPAARGLWESVPRPVRAAGPEAVWKFHKGKDWSHIVPRSVGGPATADNGVWWSSIKNKRLGASEMSAADLADATAALRSEAIRSSIKLTLSGMVKGALIGVVAGALLACLECGLKYAQGKIDWPQMVDKIVMQSIVAGIGGMIITGVIIGVSLLFPFIIPILAPLMFALQIVSLLFLGRHLFTLAQGWWEVLDGEGKLTDFVHILRRAQSKMRDAFDELREEGAGAIVGWLEALAKRVGVDEIWKWIATQTQFAMESAGELKESLANWDRQLEFDVGAIGEAVARVVATEFEEAISTTERLLESVAGYRKSVHRVDSLSGLSV